MRDLIGERPNIVPSGLGNGNSDMDMSIFTDGRGAASDHNDEEGGEEANSLNDDNELQSDDGGDESEDSELDKRKGKETDGMANKEVAKLGRTGAKPGNSRPTARPVKEKPKKRKADEFANIAEAEELTRQKQLELARAKVEAKQAMKEAEYAYKMQKIVERRERRKARDEERAERLRLLRLREERGMVLPNGTAAAGAAYASRSGTAFGLASHSNSQAGDASIHSSLSNQGFSSTFASSSTSGSYYHNNSPALPASDHASSSGMNEFAFTLPESLSSYAGSTPSGRSSEHSTERMGSPSSSSMYGSFSGP